MSNQSERSICGVYEDADGEYTARASEGTGITPMAVHMVVLADDVVEEAECTIEGEHGELREWYLDGEWLGRSWWGMRIFTDHEKAEAYRQKMTKPEAWQVVRAVNFRMSEGKWEVRDE